MVKIKSKILISIIIITILIVISSCGKKTTDNKEEVVYPVEVKRIKVSERSNHLEYFGIINSQIINYSFTMSGKVESIFVSKNQHVTKGTKLIQLETAGLKLALSAAKHQLSQAQSAHLEAKRYYQNLKNAYESGGISESELDKAKLDRDVKEQEYQQAIVNLQAKQYDLKHATLIAASEGIVSDIAPKAGELIEAGAETIIVQGTGFFAETSIAQKDINKIDVGVKAVIEFNNQKIEGNVTYISSLPDFQTFRHTVKIDFTHNQSKIPVAIGQTVKVFLETGTISGIWIPVNCVYNDGENFVHVVEHGRLRKKRIHLIDFSGDNVRIDGLSENEQLIIKGAANINEGYRLKITNSK
jgi:RND family efflux transporter MFP subunit